MSMFIDIFVLLLSNNTCPEQKQQKTEKNREILEPGRAVGNTFPIVQVRNEP